ncbi:MAG: hypothetical protein NVS3B16_16040 [Vulcanimicrobiaceae bacterium]
MFGSLFSALAALSFLSLAAGAFVAPTALAENYGLPVENDAARAYVRALGARDGVLGLLVITFLIAKARRPLGATVGLSALVGASDFAIVYTTRGLDAKKNLAIHGVGTVGLLAVWGLVRAGL